MHADEYVAIGKIIGAHGVRGACRVYSYADTPAIFSAEHRFYFQDSDRGMVAATIVEVRHGPQRLLLKFQGIDDRNAAQNLAGTELWIRKNTLPEPEEGTYYWFELIGLTVISPRGEALGTLEQILPTGSNDVYVVRNPAGGETLVPALETVIVEVDLEENRMIVDLPDGL